MVEPYVLQAGEGRVYRWHGARVEMKAGSAELDGLAALMETTIRKGQEPGMHVHDEEHELFYILEGELTFMANGRSFNVDEGGFVFVPRGTPHSFTIRSDGDVRYLVLSVPGTFGDHVEATGERIGRQG